MSSTIQTSGLLNPIVGQHMTSEEDYSLLSDNSPTVGVLTQNNTMHLPALNSAFQPRNSKISSEKNFSENKISEALFVKLLITKCKRIAPLWFRGVSSMREKNRGEHKKVSANFGNNQNEWINIVGKINEMTASDEGDAVVNLLRKLYKELPLESVYWFIHCWLSSEESEAASHECVISRGDAKGRMRRIDCGKGSDKVWRLDTVVGMLYHGLPMSSTDTSMMIHTCDEELCVRPQHLRFRATSVALVVVLKALTQAGYTIISPKKDDESEQNSNAEQPFNRATHGDSSRDRDEHVDVYGPFSIEQVEQYRIETVLPTGNSFNKLALNSSDYEMIEMVPLFKSSLHYVDNVHQQTLNGLRNNCQQPSSDSFHHKNASNNCNNTQGRNSHGVSPTSTASYSSSCSNFPRNYQTNLTSINNLNNENIFFPNQNENNNSITMNGSHQNYPDLFQWSPVPKAKELGSSSQLKSAFLGHEKLRNSLKRKIEENSHPIRRENEINPDETLIPRQPAKKRLEARTPTGSDESSLINIMQDFISPSESQKPLNLEFIGIHDDIYSMPDDRLKEAQLKLDKRLSFNDKMQRLNEPYDEEEEELAGIAASKHQNQNFVQLLQNAIDDEKSKKASSDNRNVSSACSSDASSNTLLPLLGASPSTPDRSPYTSNIVKKSPEFPDIRIFQNSDNNNNSSYRSIGESDRTRFIKLLRNSPQYQTNPELIEILINISQQYGQKKVSSRCVSSSGIQSVFYDKVFNSSLSSSPVQLTTTLQQPEEFPVLCKSPSQRNDSPISQKFIVKKNHNIEDSKRCSKPNSTNIRTSLRQLSFTPLSVEPDTIFSFKPIDNKALSPNSEEN